MHSTAGETFKASFSPQRPTAFWDMVSEVEPSHAFLQAGTLKAAFGAGRICNGFVVARKGAVVRQDASLRSPLICTLTRSTKVLCVDEATVPSRHAVSRGGRVKRVRIVAPMQGWCSAKSLRFEDRIIHLTSSEDLIHRLGNKIKGAWHKIDAATKRRDETLLELLREKVVIVTDKEFVQNLGTHNESQSRSNFADVDGLRRACDRSQESAPQKMETDNSLSVLSLRAAIEQENKTCQTDTYGADGIDYKGRALPRRPEVAELDDSNFEKATRAVTGDAEDWLVRLHHFTFLVSYTFRADMFRGTVVHIQQANCPCHSEPRPRPYRLWDESWPSRRDRIAPDRLPLWHSSSPDNYSFARWLYVRV